MDRQIIEAQLQRKGGVLKDLYSFTKLLLVVCAAIWAIMYGGPVYIVFISVFYMVLALAAHSFAIFFKAYLKKRTALRICEKSAADTVCVVIMLLVTVCAVAVRFILMK